MAKNRKFQCMHRVLGLLEPFENFYEADFKDKINIERLLTEKLIRVIPDEDSSDAVDPNRPNGLAFSFDPAELQQRTLKDLNTLAIESKVKEAPFETKEAAVKYLSQNYGK